MGILPIPRSLPKATKIKRQSLKRLRKAWLGLNATIKRPYKKKRRNAQDRNIHMQHAAGELLCC